MVEHQPHTNETAMLILNILKWVPGIYAALYVAHERRTTWRKLDAYFKKPHAEIMKEQEEYYKRYSSENPDLDTSS